ncbi:hypothetical protein E5347_05990 [Clostridium sartagoforme]|uniref:Lipoprotein n=1 Tax=Clostridium sartagoforme TaxID=84031 RepID=A0A4V3RLN2_9CLOT|nr:hypothetical protein [Clostridium sartagoforme]TGY44360.1 hypothetical protein E5347_05990 [Clostridium sartagoforme]
MNRKGRKKVFLSGFIILINIAFIGCNNTEPEEPKIELSKGAIAIENSGEYKIYNLKDNKYELVDTDYIITSYDEESGTFVLNDKGEIKLNSSSKEYSVEVDEVIVSPKVSLKGKYLSYFVKDGYLDLKIKDIESNTYVDFNSDVIISGDLIDWINEDTLVYYGIDNNKNNGVFTYNIPEKKENLLFKLDIGYVEYLEVIEENLIIVQEKDNKERFLKVINNKGEIVETIDKIVEVSDVEVTKDGIYILGRLENNNYSLYKYSEGSMKRLVYDFPKLINLERGLSKDKDGNIIFVGGDDKNTEKLYISVDGAISQLEASEGKYHFIDIN